jgi:hypothetical protein
LIIKEIIVRGKNKEDAFLQLKKGLNVISGASDTGKSYVVDCLKFIFGSSEVPKGIKQSNGYTTLIVKFEKNDGTTFSLQRELEEESVVNLIEEINDKVKVTTLKKSHTDGKMDNLSNWFLDNFNLANKKLLKGKTNLDLASLSIRILEKIFLVDETRIIANYSPLGTGQNNERTQELALMKFLLTGEDDRKSENIKKQLKEKIKLDTKINNLNELLETFSSKDKKLEKTIKESDERIKNLKYNYEQKDKLLKAALNINKDAIAIRKQLIHEIKELQIKNEEKLVLINRFKVLKEKYSSDKERIIGIKESTDYFELYEKITCPTCGNNFNEKLDEENIEILKKAIESELKKIERSLTDLKETINDLFIDIENIEFRNLELKEDLEEKELILDLEVNKIVSELNDLKEEINLEEIKFKDERLKIQMIEKLSNDLSIFKTQSDNKNVIYSIENFLEEKKIFEIEVSELLKRWSFIENDKVTFDLKTRDIIIGDKPRSHFGKGYRAICFSAFIVALMNLKEKENMHPGFVILDSPLTSYKKADLNKEETEEESLSANIIYGFYRDLCDNYHDKQVIVFENEDPEESLHELMNYVHFSKNRTLGRYGFFPIN